MAAEIIFDADRGMQEQMQEVLALADPASDDTAHIHWYPRPNKPHGGVVQVPDHLAEKHAAALSERRAQREAQEQRRAEEEAALADDGSSGPEPDSTPDTQETAPTEQPTASRRTRRGAATASTTEATSEEAGNA